MSREMKDSGIEWIGEIPKEWRVIPHKYVMHKTKDICEHYTNEDIISLTMNGVVVRDLAAGGKMPTSFDGYQYVEPGDLLLCLFDIDVTPRCVGIVRNYGVTSPAYSRFCVHLGYYNAYYDYLLRFIDDEKIFIHLSKNLRSSLTENDFGAIKTIVPPLSEQQKIADYLDSACAKIDDVITKTKATIEEYKKLKQSVITEAVTKGIRPNREMKDSGSVWFNNIPSDWDCQKLKFVFHIQKDIAGEEGYTVLSITQKGIIPKDLSKNEGQLAQNYSNYQFVHIGDFAMNHMDLLTGWVDISKYEGVTSPDYRVFVLNNAENNSKNYYLYMMQMCYSNKIFYGLGQGVSGFGRWRLQADKFLNFYIPIPPYEEQQEIAGYLDKKCSEIDNLIAKKEQIAAELENYKKSLIYEYVTGKREVSDMNEKEETITIFDPQAARRMQMALAYKVIKQSGNDLKGRIHLMKIIYMLDCMLGLGLGINYLRYTRGPYNPIIESIEKNLSDKGIISVNTAKNYSYTVIDDSFDSKYNELFAKHNSEIEKIIDYMKRMKSSRAEKIATLYAAWNDMVIDGVQNITDKMIIDDVMNNWTENKAKTDFSTWQHILNDMKDKKIIPHGYGKHTRPRSE